MLKQLDQFRPTAGIFAAAVADYSPADRVAGKIPSGGALRTIDVVPTAKVIDLVQHKAPTLKMVSFKYQENLPLEDLFAIARERVARGHVAVVANRGEDTSPLGEQVAYLVTQAGEPKQLKSKLGIARGIADFLESAD